MVKKCDGISESLDMKFKLLLLLICSLSGMALVILSGSKYGPAISTDSVAYMYSAKSLLEGRGYVYFGYETPFIQWPPLYPTLLAIIISTGVEAWTGALYINAAIFGGIIFLLGLWLLRDTKNFIIALIGSLVVLFSIPVFHVSKYVWSEPLFILLTLLFFIHISEYIKKDKILHFYLAAVFSSLAFLTRYTGAIVLISGCVVVLIKKNSWAKKIKETVLYGLISGSPLLLWIIRNYRVSSTLMGARTPSHYTLKQNINFAWATIISWFIPNLKLEKFLSYGIIPALIIAMLILGVSLFIVPVLADGIKKSRTLPGNMLPLAAPLVFVLLYIPYLVLSATSVAFDTIDDRLMSPVYVPLIFILFYIFAYLIDINDIKNKKNTYIFSLVGIILILLIYPTIKVTYNIKQSIDQGAGVFSTDKWHNSDLINCIRENPPEGTIYSNNPDAIYAISGIPAMYTPKKDSLPEYGFEKFKGSLAAGTKSYIVWFNDNNPSTIYNVNELGLHFKMELVAELNDGKIYAIISP
jgi:4-amino-4-deoxy-L-arabinose transferase-like glycosyltransferase